MASNNQGDILLQWFWGDKIGTYKTTPTKIVWVQNSVYYDNQSVLEFSGEILKSSQDILLQWFHVIFCNISAVPSSSACCPQTFQPCWACCSLSHSYLAISTFPIRHWFHHLIRVIRISHLLCCSCTHEWEHILPYSWPQCSYCCFIPVFTGFQPYSSLPSKSLDNDHNLFKRWIIKCIGIKAFET